jgi:capsule polysaccharide export protein KpsC/LpsZ
MRVLIGKPTKHIDMLMAASDQDLMYNDDVKILYDMLPDIIKKIGIECINIDMTKNIRRIYQEKDSIFLAWHNHGTTKNTWFIKQGYLLDYFYFDKTGYSGWSELAQTYEYDVDIDDIRDEVKAFTDNYIANNSSRYNQSYIEPIPEEPYVVVFEQRNDDAVADLSYIDDFIPKVEDAFKDTEYTVYVKPHPLQIDWTLDGPVWSVNKQTGSLHELIANSASVYTINSSAGFEALLHGKRVFTAGHCDYHWVTDVLKTDKDIVASIDLLNKPVDTDSITKFLHYVINHHYMNINDEDSIIRKINRAVEHYNA